MLYPKQVDLYTLKVGDTVELASGATKEVRSVAYDSILRSVQVVFTTCKSTLPWNYQRDGAEPYFPMDSIVKIIPRPKLDFSMNTVDLTTLKEGDTVHLSDRSTTEVVSVASKMLGIVYAIRLRWLGFNRYCVDGYSLDKDKPSIVRIVDTSTAKERVVPKPKLNLYTLEPGAVVTLANGNTKEVLKVDLQSRAHTNHICITLADGVWIYNPDGTRPPGRDSAYDIVGVTKITPKPKPTPLTIGGHILKPGDLLTRANGNRIVVDKITPTLGGSWKVWHGAYGGISFEVDSSGRCWRVPGLSITAVVPNQTATFHPWPKPITTPPTKKDADPIRQIAVLDKDGDWVQEEWWAVRDMLAAGEITGWAHTQAWYDAKNKLSDPWN